MSSHAGRDVWGTSANCEARVSVRERRRSRLSKVEWRDCAVGVSTARVPAGRVRTRIAGQRQRSIRWRFRAALEAAR